ncbi:hypothetical protein C1645_758126 [Glomus cerebriforme]|uniref:Uncharacterized protein n=1 Tax=Glomus cerebriforme TaxID=658196 RepID=A0A397TA85_9GLOM|nr:hypothetical protein C1645_758126 [Glomus cerebriforme]
MELCVVVKLTSLWRFSKEKFERSYSNSHGTLFNVNFALNVEILPILLGGSFLKLLRTSSILFTLLENNLTQSFVSLQSRHCLGGLLLILLLLLLLRLIF